MLPHNLRNDKCNKNVNNVIDWTIKITVMLELKLHAQQRNSVTVKELDLICVQFENLWMWMIEQFVLFLMMAYLRL